VPDIDGSLQTRMRGTDESGHRQNHWLLRGNPIPPIVNRGNAAFPRKMRRENMKPTHASWDLKICLYAFYFNWFVDTLNRLRSTDDSCFFDANDLICP
jgi:hypothetical protein